MIDIKIDFTDSFNKKTNPQNYEESLKESIEYVTNIFVEECSREAPKRTGRLSKGHYYRMDGLSGHVGNIMYYAPYVIFGTSRQPANDYPSRVANQLNIGELVSSRFADSLIMRGF